MFRRLGNNTLRCYATLILYKPCPEKRDRQYFGRNCDKFRQLFIIFGTNYPDSPCDWKIVKCSINTYTTLRNEWRNCDVIEKFVSEKKGPTVLWTWFWQIQIYSFNFFAKNIVTNAKLLAQQKSASPNQCRCFTLQTKQWPCIAKRKVITDNCNYR